MTSQAELTTLLPTPYLLIYALPLLLFSLAFTFTGTFLTLDRTRTFPARGTGAVYASLPMPGSFDHFKKRTLIWNFEGGIGGLIGGFIFGVLLSTALSLLIPATTASATLSYKSFLAVWLLSVIPTTALAARYRYVAYAFFGVSGGTCTSLAICVIVHPSLSPRVIFTIICLILFFVSSLVFATIPRLNDRIFHPFLRISTASTGAFGLVQAIALLMHPAESSWANVWERLWVTNGDNWGTTREHGLSAAYCIFFLLGITGDWALHKLIGECPDEKWDDYLSHYTANLPNQPDRAGSFQPFNSILDRWLHPSKKSPFKLYSSEPKGAYPPSDVDFKAPLVFPFTTTGDVGEPLEQEKLRDKEVEGVFPLSGYLREKPGKRRQRRQGKPDLTATRDKKPVKFGSDLSSESESEDDDGETSTKNQHFDSVCSMPVTLQDRSLANPPQPTRPLARTDSTSAATLVDRGKATRPIANALGALDYEKEITAVKDKLGRNGGSGEVEYSDYEEDISLPKANSRNTFTDDKGQWRPAFLVRHQSQGPPVAQILPGAMPVPATPSLIKAIDRIAIAQRDAFGIMAGGVSVDPVKPKGVQSTEEAKPAANQKDPGWEEFWKEVKVKAHS